MLFSNRIGGFWDQWISLSFCSWIPKKLRMEAFWFFEFLRITKWISFFIILFLFYRKIIFWHHYLENPTFSLKTWEFNGPVFLGDKKAGFRDQWIFLKIIKENKIKRRQKNNNNKNKGWENWKEILNWEKMYFRNSNGA